MKTEKEKHRKELEEWWNDLSEKEKKEKIHLKPWHLKTSGDITDLILQNYLKNKN